MRSQLPAVPRTGYQLALAGLGISGAALVIFATSRFGLRVTPDSVTYISVARNLLTGAGFVQYNGFPLLYFPPLYPALLAVFSAVLGSDPLASARLVNALLFAAILYTSGLLFRRYLGPSAAYPLLAVLSVLVSVPLLPDMLSALSEPLFILLLLLFFFVLDTYLGSGTRSSLALLALLAMLVSLTRYVGIILVPVGVLSVWLFHRGRDARRVPYMLVFALVSCLPLAIWALRDLALSGTLFGPRMLSEHTVYENGLASLRGIFSWFLPLQVSASHPMLLLLVVTAILIMSLALQKMRAPVSSSLLACAPLWIFVLCYVGFLVLSSETAFTQAIDDRYLSPIFVPVMVVVLAFGKAVIRVLLGDTPTKLARPLLLLALGAWLFYPASVALDTVNTQLVRGRGYTSRAWRESQTLRYLRDHRSLETVCELYSNGPDAIYILLGLRTQYMPAKEPGPVPLSVVPPSAGRWPPGAKACLIQLDEIDRRTYLYTDSELLDITRLDKAIPFDDGAIYIVSRR